MTPDQKKLAAHFVSEIREHMSERDFQRDFFESVADQFEAKGTLTEKQMAALDRIYERVTQ